MTMCPWSMREAPFTEDRIYDRLITELAFTSIELLDEWGPFTLPRCDLHDFANDRNVDIKLP